MGYSFASTYLLPFVIAIIMFNLGLGLKIEDFRNIYFHPRAFFTGLFSQMILLPLVAFGISAISDLTPQLKTGIIIIAACPGGAVSNLITYYLKGNVPLSIALTSVNSLLIVFTIPFVVYLGLETFMNEGTYIHLPVFYTIARIFLMIIIPVTIGMYIRRKHPGIADTINQYMKYIILILLAGVYFLVVFEEKGGSITDINRYLNIMPYVFSLNVIGMFIGFFIARICGFNLSKQITLSVEVGIQNSALAITVASSFLGSREMALPSLVYGIFTFFNAVIFGLFIRKQLLKKKA